MNQLEKAISILLRERPYYAHFFLNSKIIFDHPGVVTAAAAVTGDSTVLIFSTKFLADKTPQETAAIIEHEVLHLLFEHTLVPFRKNIAVNFKIANIAMDCAINQYINGLPKGGITLEGLKKMCKTDLKPLQTWEYYYTKLNDFASSLSQTSTMDQHGVDLGEKMPYGIAKAVLRTAVDKSIKAAKGIVPEVVMKEFASLSAESTIPWQQILANFISRHASSSFLATRKKMHRRYGLDQPGKKKKKELILGVCLDSSGSVDDEDFLKFLSEVHRLSPLCNKTYVIDADCEVQDVVVVKKKDKMKLKRSGNGGTAYQPAISKCLELKCDAIIYFGDFDSADTPKNPGVPFLWVGVGNSPKPGDFGNEIRI